MQGNGWWWLRSSGGKSYYAADVNDYGSIYSYGYYVSNRYGACVPVIHVNLSSALWLTEDDGTSGAGGNLDNLPSDLWSATENGTSGGSASIKEPTTNPPLNQNQNTNSNSGTGTAKIGESYKINDYTYKITGSREVSFAGVNNKKETAITIPEIVVVSGKSYNVTKIENKAFQKSQVTKVKIGENVKNIGSKAFYSCKKLTSLTIPANVSKIVKQAFANCKSLKNITVKTTKLTNKNVGNKAFKGIYAKAKIKVPKKKFAAYKKLFKSKGVGSKVTFKK